MCRFLLIPRTLAALSAQSCRCGGGCDDDVETPVTEHGRPYIIRMPSSPKASLPPSSRPDLKLRVLWAALFLVLAKLARLSYRCSSNMRLVLLLVLMIFLAHSTYGYITRLFPQNTSTDLHTGPGDLCTQHKRLHRFSPAGCIQLDPILCFFGRSDNGRCCVYLYTHPVAVYDSFNAVQPIHP